MNAVLFGKTSARFFDPLEPAYNWQSFLEGRPAFWPIVYAVYVFVIWYETFCAGTCSAVSW